MHLSARAHYELGVVAQLLLRLHGALDELHVATYYIATRHVVGMLLHVMRHKSWVQHHAHLGISRQTIAVYCGKFQLAKVARCVALALSESPVRHPCTGGQLAFSVRNR